MENEQNVQALIDDMVALITKQHDKLSAQHCYDVMMRIIFYGCLTGAPNHLVAMQHIISTLEKSMAYLIEQNQDEESII